MIFSSLEFFVFLVVVLVSIGLSRGENARRNILLLSSYVFYGWWDWRFCFLIAASTTIDFIAGLRIESSQGRVRKSWLVVSLAANLGILSVFKYANFFLDSFQTVLEGTGVALPHLHIILPVGVSFFTFQTMSYSIDVYRGALPPTRNFRDFALFVSFFPQLVAGPIVRGSEFLPQLKQKHPLRSGHLAVGAEIFLRGFVKKVLFADTLAIYVDPVFAHPESYSTLTCWLAITAYAGQIYYDFSGYSGMAIGVGKMLGFELPENFRHPYRSLNITEFWRRWHISLSSWLRDYLYIPLGGNRGSTQRTYVNLMLTMLLGGLWHGASWTFVVWGGLHGSALAIHKFLMGRRTQPSRRSLVVDLASWLGTFVFVLITWVFFRAQNFGVAWTYLGKLAGVGGQGLEWVYLQAVAVLSIGAAIHVAVVLRGDRDLEFDFGSSWGWASAAVALLAVLLYAPFGVSPFIYFQF